MISPAKRREEKELLELGEEVSGYEIRRGIKSEKNEFEIEKEELKAGRAERKFRSRRQYQESEVTELIL